MCGVFGIWLRSKDRPDEAGLRQSAKLLHHRGPDAHRVVSEEGFGAAHARLSLIDLDPRSDQPFVDPTGRYLLIYNGEVYNFKELREELSAEGVVFITSSDTEVVLHALIRWPVAEALARFHGMFGLGFWDRQERRLVIARDRFGMKPLFVTQDEDRVMFASEVKALRPWMDFSPDALSISAYLLGHGGPTKGPSFYQGVRSLTPGHFAVIDDNGFDQRSFFELPDFLSADELERQRSMTDAQAVDHLEELLLASVQRHMLADAPVGSFCGGGVDSATLLSMASRGRPDLQIFHAEVVGEFSEVSAARELADYLKVDLHVVRVEEQDFIKTIPQVMAHYEHPFTYHPNCAPFMLVSRLAGEKGMKAMLSGEGSDECFLGYPWLGRKKLVDAYHGVGRRLRSFVRGLPEVGRILWPYDGRRRDEVADLLSGTERSEDEVLVRAKLADFPDLDEGHGWTLHWLHYHLRTLLVRNDTLGMEASIESRFPFLDPDVVRYAVNMPTNRKLKPSIRTLEAAHPFIRDKWALRQVAARYLPRSLSERKKLGFWTTVFQRLNIRPSYFRDSDVQDMLRLNTRQWNHVLETSHPELALRLLQLDVWSRVCWKNEAKEPISERLLEHIEILERPNAPLGEALSL